MELIYTNLNNINIPKGIVGCVGVFDGVHNGHNSVIGTVKEIGKSCNLKTALITFDPHPDYVLGKTCDEYYIESAVLRSKISTLERKKGKGHYTKYNIKAFTERGLYM